MEVSADRKTVLIHYNGWPTRWDEWILFSSPRIAPFRSRTVHSVHSPFISPSPVSLVPNAPFTGDEDVRIVLPEVGKRKSHHSKHDPSHHLPASHRHTPCPRPLTLYLLSAHSHSLPTAYM